MRVLVVGGAGYIGSHMCKRLAETGHDVVVVDNLVTGHREAVRWGPLIEASIGDIAALGAVFDRYRFDAVMHFAAYSLVAESVTDPFKYYQNNVAETLALLRVMRDRGVMRFVFSSTAAVFGAPQQQLIDEAHPVAPINPYGASKLMVERLLADAAAAYGLRAVALRYFNAAGADPEGLIGESHEPETHLIPRLLRRAAGEALDVKIFGSDYSTPDGTCIRDYIHVNDIAAAHLLALEYLEKHGGFSSFNLGNGTGYSVRQVVTAVEAATGRSLGIESAARRLGDPARLVASSALARDVLGWRPSLVNLHTIIASAWRWHQAPKF